jgi:hypothetical protein
MHYLELINRILKMKVISDDVSSTLFEGTYADASRLVEERVVFKSDPTLIRHITTRFPEGFRDVKAGGQGHQNVDEQRAADFKDIIRC